MTLAVMGSFETARYIMAFGVAGGGHRDSGGLGTNTRAAQEQHGPVRLRNGGADLIEE